MPVMLGLGLLNVLLLGWVSGILKKNEGPEYKMTLPVEPRFTGTLNVLNSCSEANVKRVVVVSSGAAVSLNPEWPKGQVKDETCWSDAEYCGRTNIWNTNENEDLQVVVVISRPPVKV
ncbi:Cinnamoyl-CoA reductase 1 [Camellia lanceoleosa]|uniref:Cinnamoyl-CoA reductase 1 n=1 Tax=Camellia lanceoleosa TaxID=1840588 RepID=A0ACC0IMK7_9ERIC|nr:Cinnamoyl-CoA reductase 1 [Camellia lanceoleosa]